MTISIDNDRALPDAARLMTQGGDGRLRLDPATGLNIYHSAPRPGSVLAYASSTANDISPAAFDRVQALLAEFGDDLTGADYARRLESLRGRIRRAYGMDGSVDIVFAPSGTDLEYVALACAGGSDAGIRNILLGADEVGSGCIHSARGAYFAKSTALGVETAVGAPVPGLGGVEVDLIDIKVRDPAGRVRPSAEIRDRIAQMAQTARSAGRKVLIHVVHGSKTGLILPSEADLDRLQSRFGECLLVVDACQARITGAAIAAYLDRGAIVFVTGSKFMGAPPFSGFAFVPSALARAAEPLAEGLATIFRRGEWPKAWPGAEHLPDSANPGLLLRLEAAIFELERFQALDPAVVEQVILAFHSAVRTEIIEKCPAQRLAPYPPGDRHEAESHPIEMRTLSTLDLSGFGGAGFDEAVGWHKALIDHGVRLGQPVKCVRLSEAAGGGWGATLRIGLAMWQIADQAGRKPAEIDEAFRRDMAQIRGALIAVTG